MEEKKNFAAFRLPLILLAAMLLIFFGLTMKVNADAEKYQKELTADRSKIEAMQNSIVDNSNLEKELTVESETLRLNNAQQKEMRDLWEGKTEWIKSLE